MTRSFACLALAACLLFPGFALAASAAPDDAPEQKEAQRLLTEKDLAAFLAASRTVEPMLARMPDDQRDDPDAAALAGLDKATEAAGLKGYSDYDEIAANVHFTLQGFDPEAKTYVGTKAMVEAEIARVKADRSLSRRDKAETLRQLDEEAQDAEDVEYHENIDLVSKHYGELSAIFKP